MIGKVSGRIDYIGTDHLLVDVRGVGYLVYVSERTLASLPGAGHPVALFTELLVREDNLQLFGFPTLLEKEWYRLLVSVQGIGAKAAMAILGALGPEGTGRAIALGDWNSVRAARGVGPKTAQRVVNELKDKGPVLMAMGGTMAVAQGADVDAAEVIDSQPAPASPAQMRQPEGNAAAQSEALSALSNLGYAPAEAARAVAEAAGATPDATTPTLIRAALKLLAPKG